MRKYFYQTVNSTQNIAKEYLKKGNLDIAYFTANEQTAGYGKRNRYFYSPAKQGIYLSVALPGFNVINKNIDLLTPALSTAVVQKLQDTYPNYHFSLKWVNDIYLNNKKIAGILTEQVSNGVVIGIGINLNNKTFPNNLMSKAGSINDPYFHQKNLVPSIVKAILYAINTYQTGLFLNKYKQLSSIINKMVTIRLGTKEIYGNVIDIDQLGHLVLEYEGKVVHLNSGEVIKIIT